MRLLARRHVLKISLVASAGVPALAACGEPSPKGPGTNSALTRVHVMGTIHSRHRNSELYSLDALEAAIRRANPDVILAEIPPERVAKAFESFEATGAVDEPRTNVFPEYTDVIIPLAGAQNWRVLGTAAWTPSIARDRGRALTAIEKDPARAAQWAEHRAARREFAQKVRGKSDDPHFIHTPEFDRLVAKSREPYARNFDADLGAGGWTQINAAHNALINEALNTLAGQGFRVLITFGTAHKYKIIESLSQRDDVTFEDTQSLFA
ncbi:MAG: hypothetical protein AAF249_00515 [Pseudomonadota bacterium]